MITEVETKGFVKLYEPGMYDSKIKERKTKEISSSELSEWTSSEED